MANSHVLDLERGSSQYAYAADSTSLSITSDISIEAWVKLESLDVDTGVVVKMDSGTTRSYEMLLRPIDASSYTFEFAWSSDGSAVTEHKLTVSNAAPIGTWTHYAITWEAAAGQTIFYINATNSGSATLSSSSINDSTSQLRIGFQQADYNSYFDGLIDEVRIWNDLRTGAEISANYQRELAGNEANLQGYWQLENGYLDSTTNDNDLTPSGTPVFSTDVPFADATTTSTSTTSTSTSTTSTSTSRTTSTSTSRTTSTSTSTSTSSTTSTSTTVTETSTSTSTTSTSSSTSTTTTTSTSTSTSTTSTSTTSTSSTTTLDYRFVVERV